MIFASPPALHSNWYFLTCAELLGMENLYSAKYWGKNLNGFLS